jgi:hypothetical protein
VNPHTNLTRAGVFLREVDDLQSFRTAVLHNSNCSHCGSLEAVLAPRRKSVGVEYDGEIRRYGAPS